ncbi:MAG: cob(I)yrinic acid a,c-diamide adenosyltransferase [Candidatus Thermoplasmatota archaeon]|nr:cob(I)yrinic acid a,c-diamide adenosyltransferase [Candidatus Thermoplasmatota archaeon]
MSEKLDKGLVQVYTGDGKGKTTAAIGLAIRAVGRDFKVYIGQFMKTLDFGEHKALARFEDKITIEQFGSGEFHVEETPSEEEIERAEKGVEKIRESILSGDYDIVIADEICVAYHFGLLGLEHLMDLIDIKPDDVELLFTGRKAPEELIEGADLVTEMKEIKHPYKRGIKARRGIEK